MDRERRLLDIAATLLEDETAGKSGCESAWLSTEALAPQAGFDDCVVRLEAAAPRESKGRLPPDAGLRFAACCALLHDPPILLLDDPAVGLDDASVMRLADWLRRTAETRLVIVVTNAAAILRLSDQILDLGGGADGEDGPPEPVRPGASPGRVQTIEP